MRSFGTSLQSGSLLLLLLLLTLVKHCVGEAFPLPACYPHVFHTTSHRKHACFRSSRGSGLVQHLQAKRMPLHDGKRE